MKKHVLNKLEKKLQHKNKGGLRTKAVFDRNDGTYEEVQTGKILTAEQLEEWKRENPEKDSIVFDIILKE